MARQCPHGGLATYRRLLGAQVRSQASYRASFAIDVASNALAPLIDIVTIVAVFQVTRSLGGFTAPEVLTMFGLTATSFTLADLAVGNIERLRTYIRIGLLDAILVRPLSVLGQLLALDFTIRRISRVAVALAVLAGGLVTADIPWTPARVLLIVVAPFAGALFFGAVFVATATVAFWWIESGEFANGFTYGGKEFSSYPVTVYNGTFRWLFGYTLGFAFAGYYPAVALLGRPDPLGAPPWVAWGTPVVALAAAVVAAAIWRTGIRHYRSTGS